MAVSVIPGSATSTAAGLMSAADKTKLDGLPDSAGGILRQIVRERYTITFTTPAVGAAIDVGNRTYSKAGYTPIFFAGIPGSYMDCGGLNFEGLAISGNTVSAGSIYFTTLISGGANKTGTIYIDVLYVPQ